MTAQLNPQRDARDYQQLDAAHHIHAFLDQKALNLEGPRVMVRGDGLQLWDNDGKRYLDGMSGLWCTNLGYGRQDLAAAASRQLEQLPYYNMFFHTTHPAVVELSEMLFSLLPDHYSHAIYTNSGSEANEVLIRTDAALLADPRQAAEEDHDRPLERLPRLDPGQHRARRDEVHARDGRHAAGLRPHRRTLLVRQRRRAEPGRVRSPRGAATGGEDPRTGRGERRRLRRRALPGRRRHDLPAAKLLAGDPAHLPAVRRAAVRRRSDRRLRPHRRMVRPRTLRLPAGHPVHRQGPDVRLHPHGRPGTRQAHRRGAGGAGRGVRPRPDLFRPPGGGGGGHRQPQGAARRGRGHAGQGGDRTLPATLPARGLRRPSAGRRGPGRRLRRRAAVRRGQGDPQALRQRERSGLALPHHRLRGRA